jgi:hypothetical protein
MKNALVLIFIVAVGSNSQKIQIKEQTIKELSSFNFSIPSPDIALFLFVKSSNDRIGRLNIITLHDIYKQAYAKSNMNFKAFLSGTLNETTSIDNEILKKKGVLEFVIDEKTKRDYNNLPMFKFESKYCEIINKGRFAIKKQYMTSKNVYSIMYYFFINNYKIIPDDYSGEYVIIK